MKSNEHKSVLLNEAIEGLNIKEDGIYVDMTLGRGGHSKEILKRIKKGFLYCFDQDEEAVSYSKNVLDEVSSNYEIIETNFKNLKSELQKRNVSKVDGILFDLGVSSPQFDEDYRGFSYRFDSPLDMRMNQNSSLTAKKIVNSYPLNDLVRIFKEYGEEKYAYNIAKNICLVRETKEINTTFELVDIIRNSIPKKFLYTGKHPAKQVFQALRIEVNDELNVLRIALKDALESLNIEGRVVVITFHSLEDRIVKNLFREYSYVKGDRKNDFLLPNDIKKADYELVNKHCIVASEEELNLNPRSHSAKLRIIKKVK